MATDETKTPEEQQVESANTLSGFLMVLFIVVVVLQIFGRASGVFDWISGQLALVGADNAPAPRDPGWLDLIFASQAFVGATRIFLVVVGIYLMAAVFHNVTRKVYPRSLGSVSLGADSNAAAETLRKSQTELKELREERDELEEIATEQASAIETLEEQLAEKEAEQQAVSNAVAKIVAAIKEEGEGDAGSTTR